MFRLFYDTIKGGDYRAREANVHRLAEVSANIIDQCVAQGVPFAREYGGLLSNRSFGGTQVQRTFYAAGQTGQQLLIGAYQALERQVALGNVKMYTRHEMLDIVKIDGKARGVICRDLVTGKLERHFGHAVLLCSGGYGNVFYLSTNAMGSNVTAIWKAHKKGAFFGNPCFTQIHPTCIPVSGDHQSKLTLMSESLRNDGRIWVPKNKMITESRVKYRKKKGIITWKEDIRHSEISCRVMWLHERQKKDAMPVLASANRRWPFTSIMRLQLSAMARGKRISLGIDRCRHCEDYRNGQGGSKGKIWQPLRHV